MARQKTTNTPTTDDVTDRTLIGEHIRRLRKQREETLVEVAKRAGLSASALSKIENGKMSPTFSILMRLAEGLGLSISDLVDFGQAEGNPTARFTVTRQKEIKFRRAGAYDIAPLCSELTRKGMTPMIERVRARDTDGGRRMIRHSGEEFVYVLSGVIDVLTEFYRPQRLQAGDSVYIDSSMPHTYASVGEEDAEILMIWLNRHVPQNEEPMDVARELLLSKA